MPLFVLVDISNAVVLSYRGHSATAIIVAIAIVVVVDDFGFGNGGAPASARFSKLHVAKKCAGLEKSPLFYHEIFDTLGGRPQRSTFTFIGGGAPPNQKPIHESLRHTTM
jgi:hypothetical protein